MLFRTLNPRNPFDGRQAAGTTHLLAASMHKDHGQCLATSRPGIRGGLERLHDRDKDHAIKRLCKSYVARFVNDNTGSEKRTEKGQGFLSPSQGLCG
jgi:hypothetical protein